MKTTLTAIALAAAFAQPAAAITFPTLTTIYVGSGVTDTGSAADFGTATAFMCTNVSGQPASVRFLVLHDTGGLAATHTVSLPHGATHTTATHFTTSFFETTVFASGVSIFGGAINIESTQSAVFCTAAIVDAADGQDGIPLHLVRVNPHPGTVE